MKVFGTRRIRSERRTDDPRLIHASQRHANAQQLEAYMVRGRPHAGNSGRTMQRRARLILIGRKGSARSDYEDIEIRFTYEETRRLERLLAAALDTRPVRKDAAKPRPLTRLQARRRLIP